jgi:hypothetical protein
VRGGGLSPESVRGLCLDLPGATALKMADSVPATAADDVSATAAPPADSPPREPSFLLTLPESAPAGVYDLQVLTDAGLSSPRLFAVSQREETAESEPNDTPQAALQHAAVDLASLPGGIVINGRLEKTGDIDVHAFDLKAGASLVLECWARRLDSKLRPVLELRDAAGQRLHPHQERIVGDPLLVYTAPATGRYLVTVRDLTYQSGAEHFYRLALDTGPRALFSVPCVVEAGQRSKVTLYGWNLAATEQAPRVATVAFQGDRPARVAGGPAYERLEITLDAPALDASLRGLPLDSTQASLHAFPYRPAGATTPLAIGLSDLPVVQVEDGHRNAATALAIDIPCELSGHLVGGDSRDWFAMDVRRGEVLWLDGTSARAGSPMDLEVSIFDEGVSGAGGNRVPLVQFSDSINDTGAAQFPLGHSDPAGRWVVPNDGRYLVVVHNALGNLRDEPRRVYRLSVRRENPDFQVVAVPRRGPGAINVPHGGRELVELFVLRSRGLTGAIQVRQAPTTDSLETTVLETPGTWLHPSVARAPLVLSTALGRASGGNATSLARLDLIAETQISGRRIVRQVRGGTLIRAGPPAGLARLTGNLAASVTPPEALRLTARYTQTPDSLGNPVRTHEVPHVSQGSLLTLAVDTEWHGTAQPVEFQLTGIGLPPTVAGAQASIAPGEERGFIAFYLPPTLPTGHYTIAVRGDGTVPTFGDDGNKNGETDVTLYTNTLSFIVYPAPFVVEIDPRSPRQIRRGEVIQVHYTARRQNGFIGKIHTEMLAPGGLRGLRGRGVTFISQSETGNIQIIASDDAPLGRRPFLRFEGAGYVEDEVLYLGSQQVDLEVVK